MAKKCDANCACGRHSGWIRPLCQPDCTCGRHRDQRITKGRGCLPGCQCNRHGDGGVSAKPNYSRWCGMMARCYKTGSISYKNYGARGIRVHDDWHNSLIFIAYIDEVLGPCPPGHTLDRIDNSGNYEPGNIRWSSRSEQRLNSRPRRSKLKLTNPAPNVWIIK